MVSVISSMVTASGGPGGPAKEQDPQEWSGVPTSRGVTTSLKGLTASPCIRPVTDSPLVGSLLGTYWVPGIPLGLEQTGRGPSPSFQGLTVQWKTLRGKHRVFVLDAKRECRGTTRALLLSFIHPIVPGSC